MRFSVINVMVDVKRIQTILPHFIRDDTIVLVGLKQKLQYNHYYMTSFVRPLKIVKAINVLLHTSCIKKKNSFRIQNSKFEPASLFVFCMKNE